MYQDTLHAMATAARAKDAYLSRSPMGYSVASMLAGAYVGLGIVLIFSLGAPLASQGSAALKLVMGASFGIALTLVVFAGSELFTGNNMVMTIGLLHRQVRSTAVARVWGLSWAGNLAGSLLLAGLVVASGAVDGAIPFIQMVAGAKMNAPALQLLLRGILCNWLVCLALWTSARAKSEVARCVLIFWCLFAFIASGFEHSVANMTLLGMALLAPHADSISWAGYGYNLALVTAGNVLGGALFVAGAYWLATPRQTDEPASIAPTPLPVPVTEGR